MSEILKAIDQLTANIESLKTATVAVGDTITEKEAQIRSLFQEHIKISQVLAGEWHLNTHDAGGYDLQDAELFGWSYNDEIYDRGDEKGTRLYNTFAVDDFALGTMIHFADTSMPDIWKYVYVNFRRGNIDITFHHMSHEDVKVFLKENGIVITHESMNRAIERAENKIDNIKALMTELPMDTHIPVRSDIDPWGTKKND